MGEQRSLDVEKCGFDHGMDSCHNGAIIIPLVLDNFNHGSTKLGFVFVKIPTDMWEFYLQVNKSLI
jgi:hypothetical protein